MCRVDLGYTTVDLSERIATCVERAQPLVVWELDTGIKSTNTTIEPRKQRWRSKLRTVICYLAHPKLSKKLVPIHIPNHSNPPTQKLKEPRAKGPNRTKKRP